MEPDAKCATEIIDEPMVVKFVFNRRGSPPAEFEVDVLDASLRIYTGLKGLEDNSMPARIDMVKQVILDMGGPEVSSSQAETFFRRVSVLGQDDLKKKGLFAPQESPSTESAPS